MTSISNIPDWHRMVLAFLGACLAVCVAIQAGVLVLPPQLAGGQFYAAVAVVFLTAFLPRWQLPTGSNAPPILSPQDPTKPARTS